jgi:hypothetical protein
MADIIIDPKLSAEIQQARQVGIAEANTEPRALQVWYELESQRVFIELQSGVVIGIPHILLQGLAEATSEQLLAVEVTPSGYGLHWESLDVDLAVPALLARLYGTQAWMAELGRKGGQAKSIAKAEAARENGKKGGRPQKWVTPYSS